MEKEMNFLIMSLVPVVTPRLERGPCKLLRLSLHRVQVHLEGGVNIGGERCRPTHRPPHRPTDR